jgi:hypothetical protein
MQSPSTDAIAQYDFLIKSARPWEKRNMELQKKLDGFRANFEADMNRKTILDNEALRVKHTGVEERALQAGQRAPDFELPDMAGNKVKLAQLRAEGPLALVFYRGLW